MSQESLQDRWQQGSQQGYARLAQWREAHPEATLQEIEAQMDRELDRLRAEILQDLANEPTGAGSQEEAEVRCPQCQHQMQAKGHKERRLQTRGGHEVVLRREYCSCPQCGYSFFPPR